LKTAREICEEHGWNMPYEPFDAQNPDPEHRFDKLIVYKDGRYLCSVSNKRIRDLVKENGPGVYSPRYMANFGPRMEFDASEECAKNFGYNKEPENIDATNINAAPSPAAQVDPMIALMLNQNQKSTEQMMQFMGILVPALAGSNKGFDPAQLISTMTSGQQLGSQASADRIKTLEDQVVYLKEQLEKLQIANEELILDNTELKIQLGVDPNAANDADKSTVDKLIDHLPAIAGAFLNPSAPAANPQPTAAPAPAATQTEINLDDKQADPELNAEQKEVLENMSSADKIKYCIANLYLGLIDTPANDDQLIKEVKNLINEDITLKMSFDNFEVDQIADFVTKQVEPIVEQSSGERVKDDFKPFVLDFVKNIKAAA
jgi:hypothetical protein